MDETLKVTDKRMFTADGELREEHRSDEAEEPAVAEDPGTRDSPNSETEAAASASPQGAVADSPGDTAENPSSAPDTDRGPDPLDPQRAEYPAPTFLDLVGLLAQPIAMFLGDAAMPGGKPEENLPLARFHIDLLELVEAKTKGNISPEEAKVVEDLLYQLRMRYVEKVS